MSTPPPVIGIDLGTTTCAVSYVDHAQRPTTLVNFEGQLTTPSALLVEGQQVVVGEEAQRAAISHPAGYVECFKRHMGEDLFPDLIDGRSFRPEFLSALMLARLKKDVSRTLGDVTRAVITVPAYFDEARRRATRDAGEIAGLDVIDILNEPTAAAICYAHRTDQLGHPGERAVERLLVYDLGGGTFDTTILEIERGQEYRTVATEGEVRLGGYDWDTRLRDALARQFREKTGVDPLESPYGRVEFMRLAQDTKHSLTLRSKVSKPCSFEGKREVLEATQADFERMTADLLDRSRQTTEMLLSDTGLSWSQIDTVLLAGGSTRMPMVSRMLASLTGKPPVDSISRDESVSHGAGIYASLLTANSNIRVVNVNAHSLRILGINRQGARVADLLIPKNSALPAQKIKVYPVASAGQTSISVNVLEGESDDPRICEEIGTVRVDDLPVIAGKRVKVAVQLRYREDGRVHVAASARNPENLSEEIKKVRATLEPKHGMSRHEIRKAQRELSTFEIV